MICRIWHGWTTPVNADAYGQLLRSEIFQGIAGRRIAGYHGIELLRRPAGESVEFVPLMCSIRPKRWVPLPRALLQRFDARRPTTKCGSRGPRSRKFVHHPEITSEAQMATYEYAVLIGRDQAGSVGGVTWYLNGIGNPLGGELPGILNHLGTEGWRVVGLGDLGFDARTEIVLLRERT